MSKFDNLFKPMEIGGVRLRNRIVMSPMATNFATEDGYVTEKQKAYYEERARGGIGLIIIEYNCIDSPVGKGVARQLCCDDDKFIPGLSDLARTVHKHGAAVALQLCHAGRLAMTRFTGCQPVAPSPLAAPGGDMPLELSLTEIDGIIEKFARAAERARKAGFDGVEIHCTHGYLLHEFASAFSNIREDTYGGNLRNRARIILDTVRAVRERVGVDYPVWARITAKEFNIKGGITLEESRPLAQWLEEAGVVALNVSATCETTRSVLGLAWAKEGEQIGYPSMAHPYGFLLPLAGQIKEVVSVPILAVGRISPEVGDKAIAQGQADMVVMGRALLCDSELPNKVASGNIDEIRPCFGCNECVQRILGGEDLHCSLNPAMGREKELQITPAAKKRRVMVVGGGPAGLEAARAAALRGHEVILLEKTARLGGKMLAASAPPYKGELLKFINYLANQVKKMGVRVELYKEATVESVSRYKPDAIVVAVGAARPAPDFPELPKMQLVNAEDVLEGGVEVGTTVAIVGGGMVGCETAEFLASKDRKVTIVEMLDNLGLDMMSARDRQLLDRLNRIGVSILLGAKATAICAQGLIFSTEEGRNELLVCDTIIMATTPKPNQELYNSLSALFPEIYLVGDCVEPRRIADAVLEGFRVGVQI